MDVTLRCNTLKCRAPLRERAVVTTCSHNFCLPCSETLGLFNSTGSERKCPACGTTLLNADDAVATQLNPSEDYKTSVLSGFSPCVIMECAGRGLAFHSYQASQEIMYQEFLAKGLRDKHCHLSSQMDQVIHEANSEITNLRNKITALESELEDMQRKNYELVEAYKDKSKTFQKTRALYDDLKKRMLQSDVQSAAANVVDQTIQDDAAKTYQNGKQNRQRRLQRPFAGHGAPNYGDDRHGSTGSGSPDLFVRQRQSPNQRSPARAWNYTDSANEHRTPLPFPGSHNFRQPHQFDPPGLAANSARLAQQVGSVPRQSLANLHPNHVGNPNMASYGMSAGAKVGRIVHPNDRSSHRTQ